MGAAVRGRAVDRAAGAVATSPPAASAVAPTDVELLLDHQAGNPEALGVLYTRHYPRVRSVCRRFVGDDATADDLAQETFHSVMRHADRVDCRYNVSSWLLSIAANLARDELRRRSRWLRLVQPPDDHVEHAVLAMPDRDRSGQPETAYEIAETRELVHEIAELLPPRQRTALLLREITRLSQAEIAGVLEISPGAVGTLLFRARSRFREELLARRSQAGPMAQCARVARLRAAMGAAALRPDQRRRVDEHLATCRSCRAASVPNTITA